MAKRKAKPAPNALLDVERIEQLRTKKGWSQHEAAKRAGFSGRQQWNNVVNGSRGVTLATLGKVADALGVKAKSLLR